MTKTITHIVRKNYAGDVINHDYAKVTLPEAPFCSIATDRSDTAPRQPIIRSAKKPARGAALIAAAKRRVEWFRQALIEVSKEVEE